MTTESYAVQEVEEPKPQNYFSIIGNVFFSPGKAFQEVARSPLLLWPLIGLIVVSLAGGYFTSRMIDTQSLINTRMEEAIAQGQVTPAQAEQAAAVTNVLRRFSFIMSPVSTLFLVLLIAGGFRMISMFMGAENEFKSLFIVTLLAVTAYTVVSSALFVLIASFKDTSGMTLTELSSMVGSNLGVLLSGLLGRDALPRFIMNLARFVDVLLIWGIALLSIGYAAVSRKMKTSTAAVWISSVYLVIAVVVAGIQSMVAR